jgi:ribosome-binding protein aMBF1 (putative translation factor)
LKALVSTKIVDVVEIYCYQARMTPEQCRAARGWLDWSQDDLASAAHVSLSTVRDFEKARHVPIANNLAAMKAALEVKGIVFVDGGGTCGIAYAKPEKGEAY